MSKSNQPNSSKNSLLRRFPHLNANIRTDGIANHMIAKKDYLGSKKNKDQTIIKVSSQNSIPVNEDLMNIDPKQKIGEGSAGIYQGLSDGFANMSIQGKTTSAQSHLAQSHSAPQTAPFPSSFNPTKTNDPNKTIGS